MCYITVLLKLYCVLIGQFYCSLCNVNFKFRSKLERHLGSADHRDFENCLQGMEGGDMEEYDNNCAGSDVEDVSVSGLLDLGNASDLDIDIYQHYDDDHSGITIVNHVA